MSVDKQQTWAEAVVECVADEKERLRLINLYEPDETADALLRQVVIANDLRSSLKAGEEERKLLQEEVLKLLAEVERLRADAERLEWIEANPEHPQMPYFADGHWYVPYLLSGAGGLGGGVGARPFATLRAAIDDAREAK